MGDHKPAMPQYEAYTDKEGKEKGHSVRRQAALTDIYFTCTYITPYTDYLFQLLPCGSSLPTSPPVIHAWLCGNFLWSFWNTLNKSRFRTTVQCRVIFPPGYRSETRRSSGRSSATPTISTPPFIYAVYALVGPSYFVCLLLCLFLPPRAQGADSWI